MRLWCKSVCLSWWPCYTLATCPEFNPALIKSEASKIRFSQSASVNLTFLKVQKRNHSFICLHVNMVVTVSLSMYNIFFSFFLRTGSTSDSSICIFTLTHLTSWVCRDVVRPHFEVHIFNMLHHSHLERWGKLPVPLAGDALADVMFNILGKNPKSQTAET